MKSQVLPTIYFLSVLTIMVGPIPMVHARNINGTHKCTNGSVMIVSGYKDWMSGTVTVKWKERVYRLQNYYKDAWGTPGSVSGYLDTGSEFKLVLGGKTVCTIR